VRVRVKCLRFREPESVVERLYSRARALTRRRRAEHYEIRINIKFLLKE
jgi:hypothetical protein